MRPWMIEINAGPCVKDGDNPILEKVRVVYFLPLHFMRILLTI